MLLEEEDPDKLFNETDKNVGESMENCHNLADTDPEEAVEVLAVAMLVAGAAYSRAVFLKLKQMDEKSNPKIEALERKVGSLNHEALLTRPLRGRIKDTK